MAWSDSGELLDRFHALNCSKTYFHGEQNANLEVIRQLREIKTESISGSGHFLINDNPDEFYSLLLKHIG